MAGATAEIKFGDLGELRAEVRIMPMATVLSLLADTAGRSQGVSPRWRAVIRAGLPSECVRVLAPLFGHGGSNIPHCLTPSVSLGDTGFDEHLQRIVDAASVRLADEVEAIYGSAMPRPWRDALRSADRWISAYAQVMTAAWRVFDPMWRQAQWLLEREIVRIGTAAVRGTLSLALADLCPRWRYSSGRLLIPDLRPASFAVGSRKLVLTPTVSGIGASMFDPDLATQVWLGYPVPGLTSLTSPVRPGADDALSALIGTSRATLLRNAGSLRSMSQLSAMLLCAPSVATYHSGHLMDAGLLYRERRGRQVYVRRTERGDALLDLMS